MILLKFTNKNLNLLQQKAVVFFVIVLDINYLKETAVPTVYYIKLYISASGGRKPPEKKSDQ